MTRRHHDNYGTHPALAEWAVHRACTLAVHPRTILEPCCGDTAPFALAGRRKCGLEAYGFDIRDCIGRDQMWNHDGQEAMEFRQCDFTVENKGPFAFLVDKFDIIATNPPFSIGEYVVRRSLDMLAPHGCAVFLVKMAFLGTQERSKLFITRPPAEIHILTARPSFTGDGQTDVAQEYAFVFWEGEQTETLLERTSGKRTTLHWLDNGPMMRAGRTGRVRIEKGQDNG